MSKNILLVDDDPVIRMLVFDCLSAFGHRVEQASCGQECLESLKEEIPQVIILDLIMPDLNGLEVLAKIRSNDAYKGVPVILLSADPDIEMTAIEREVWADMYLQKPFDIQTILDAIEQLG